MVRSTGDSVDSATESDPILAQLPPSSRTPLIRAIVAVVAVAGLFASAMVLSRVLARTLTRLLAVGGPGSFSGLFVNTVALHLFGFGIPAAVFLLAHRRQWLSYLRLTECTQWTVFYGTAVGLALMVVTVTATVLFTLFAIEPAESASGQAQSPLFYFVLFVISSAFAVPMEELFFRGLIQRRLADGTHVAVGIALSSVLFASIHSTISVGSGGEFLAFGMFVGFGIVLGVAYHYTANLFVPIIGHVVFNGVQILLRGLEVAL